MNPRQIIVSFIGHCSVEIPTGLLAEIQREREWHQADIKNRIGEVEHSALLAHAEAVKLEASNHIKHADSGA